MADEDEAAIYRYEDLHAARIVSGRTDLARKIKDHDFPRPIKLGARQTVYLKSEVSAWVLERAALRDAPKQIAPPPKLANAALRKPATQKATPKPRKARP